MKTITLSPKNAIATQLLQSVFATYVGLAAAVTLLHVSVEYWQTKADIQRELRVNVGSFEEGLSLALFVMNSQQLEKMVQGILNLPIVTGVEVEDETGAVVARGGALQRQEGGWDNADAFFYQAEISHTDTFFGAEKTETVGKITVYSNSQVALDRVRVGFFLLLLNAVIKTLALWVIFLIIARKLLHRPLQDFIAATSQIHWQRLEHCRVRVDVRGDNELRTLEASFNQMLQRLQEARDQLQELNNTLEQKVEQRTRALQHSLQTIQEFYHFLSHELRTPITSIRPYLRFIKRGMRCEPPTPGQLAHIEGIEQNIERMHQLLNQVLDLARIEARAGAAAAVPVLLHPLIRQAARQLGGLLRPEVRLAFDLAQPDRPVRGVRDDLTTVLHNLLSNAAKFTERGAVTVSTEQAAQTLTVRVEDTGPGIAPEHRPALFERFMPLGPPHPARGSGLGLNIAKTLVERMGGRIGFEPKEDSGSIFWFTLPLADGDDGDR